MELPRGVPFIVRQLLTESMELGLIVDGQLISVGDNVHVSLYSADDVLLYIFAYIQPDSQ